MTALVKFVLIFSGGLVLSLAIYFFLLSPTLNQLSEQSAHLKQKNVEVVTMKQQIVAYKNAQTDLSKAAEKDQVFEAFLDREGLVAAVKSLEKAAVLTKTTELLKITEPDQDSKNKPAVVAVVIVNKNGLEEIPYRVTTLNDFGGTVQFIRYLEHLPQFSEISKINLSAETVESDASKTKVYTGRVFGSIDAVFFVKEGLQ